MIIRVGRVNEHQQDSTIREILDREQSLQIPGWETSQAFASTAENVKTKLTALLSDVAKQGKTVAGYGAPAKGNTLLSYLDLGPDDLPFIADRSDLKQGLFTPGHHIPVTSPERIDSESPDYLLLLAWNFAEEIMNQLSDFRSGGGKFIIPVPEPRIV